MKSTVRFGKATEIASCTSADEIDPSNWHDSQALNQRFATDLKAAKQRQLPSNELRGLEAHLCSKRTKFADMYVQAVVQKSLALRSAKYMGKKVNVEERLHRFAAQHAKASSVIAQELARQDQQEALDIYAGACPAKAVKKATTSVPTSHRRRQNNSRLARTYSGSRERTTLMAISV